MITIEHLNKSFNSINVLKNINLTINQGEIFGIVGHSGAGKSTLLRCINGLETYDSGTLAVMGKNISSLNPKALRIARKNIGIVFQNANLLPSRNVFDNIALPLKAWRYDKVYIKQKVNQLLKLIGLEDKIFNMPNELSGGQSQRVSIARALALEPKILLCDEATSALDPKITTSILHLLNRINKELNITIVIVTHEMEVIKHLCTRVAIMYDGSICACDYVDKLFLSTNHKIQALLGENEILPIHGINFKIFYTDKTVNQAIIAQTARDLNINLSIVWGKLEQFGNRVLGSLVVNVEGKDADILSSYLTSKNISFSILQFNIIGAANVESKEAL